jgi:cytochrome b
MTAAANSVRVWDPFIRLFHWTVVVGFFIAYFTEGEGDVELLHVWTGYVISVLVLLRIVWGFVGPRHARFADFVTGPGTGLRYLISLVRFRAKRYVGHSPAGGWMVLLLIVGLLATTAAGMATYGERGHGPLAPVLSRTATVPAAPADAKAASLSLIPKALADDDEGERREGRREESSFKELHELFGNIVLFLVILHVCGVVFASIAHREDLVRAMVTGRKKA